VPLRALALLLLSLIAYWPQLQLQDWRGTEGRRVLIALEMAASGDLLVPTLNQEPTYAKPPLHYWLLAAVERLWGHGQLAMRLPAVVALWLAALLAFALLARSFGRPAGWVGALGVLLSPILLLSMASAEIDPLFACLGAASLWCLAYGVALQRHWVVIASGCLGALAVLQKGPPYLLFASGAWLVWWRHRGLRHGWSYFLPLLLPPLLYYGVLWLRVPFTEFAVVAREESVGRAAQMAWTNVRDTPAYWLKGLAMLLPLGLFCTWEFRGSRDARMGPPDLMLRMCTGAVVSSLFLLTFFPLRPTRYLLPNVLLFVFAVAPAVAHYAQPGRVLGGPTRMLLRGFGLLGAAALVALPFLPAPYPGRSVGAALVLALLPLLVQTGRQVVASCLWLPLIAAWTIGADFAEQWQIDGRAHTLAAPLLARELAARGGGGELQTFGHCNSGLQVAADLLGIAGDERMAQPPQMRWVLYETDSKVGELPGYRDRLRLRLPVDAYVLAERVEHR